MAKGRLSNTEKYAIQGMVANNVAEEEIAQELGRSLQTVEKYLGELDSIHGTIAKVHTKKLKQMQDEINRQQEELQSLKKGKQNQLSLDAIKQKVYERINDIPGLAQGTSIELVNRALAKTEQQPQDEEELFAWAIREINAKDLMIRETGAKKTKSVSVMTKAASERGDDFRTTMPNSVSRTARKNLFDIQKGEIIDG